MLLELHVVISATSRAVAVSAHVAARSTLIIVAGAESETVIDALLAQIGLSARVVKYLVQIPLLVLQVN